MRFARDGESLKLLNEQTVTMQSDMLVIADGKNAIALAGMMGGADSAVDDATKDIFLESAFFAPGVIAGKSRRLGFGSDSSYRFERGVDFAATQTALDHATQLILNICGGHAGAMTEVCGELPARQPVKLRTSRVHRVLGLAIDADQISRILSRLGMVSRRTGDEFSVTPPSYRFDIAIEEDLIEEVARVCGYENITPLPPLAAMGMLPHSEAMRPLAKLRQALVLRGLSGDHQLCFRGSRVGTGPVRQCLARCTAKPHRQPDERDAQHAVGWPAWLLAHQPCAETGASALVRSGRVFCCPGRQLRAA